MVHSRARISTSVRPSIWYRACFTTCLACLAAFSRYSIARPRAKTRARGRAETERLEGEALCGRRRAGRSRREDARPTAL